jgi:hypothetical protein
MSDLSAEMLRKVLGLTLWVWIAIGVVALLVAILLMICIWAASRRRTKRTKDNLSQTQIPIYSKEIPVDRVGGGGRSLAQTMHERDHPSFPPQDSKHASREPGKTPGHVALSKSSDHDNVSQGSSVCNVDRVGSVHSGEDGSSGHARKPYSPAAFVSASPLVGLPEFSNLGWGHWFTLRDLEFATNRFSKENVLGEGGYGVVYRGRLVNGTEVAIKKIFNNMYAHFQRLATALIFMLVCLICVIVGFTGGKLRRNSEWRLRLLAMYAIRIWFVCWDTVLKELIGM